MTVTQSRASWLLNLDHLPARGAVSPTPCLGLGSRVRGLATHAEGFRGAASQAGSQLQSMGLCLVRTMKKTRLCCAGFQGEVVCSSRQQGNKVAMQCQGRCRRIQHHSLRPGARAPAAWHLQLGNACSGFSNSSAAVQQA